jgi:APA family basic amino acid/polyamine antiporter
VDRANWGHDWHTFAPTGFGGIGLAAGLIFFSYIGFDAVSTTAQEAKNPQRDLPIGIIVSLTICTLLYIGVAAVLTGMVPWRDVNIEAPIARAFLDHNLGWASNIITVGALAGLTSVMLVMLLGQSRVLYAMAQDGLLPKSFFGSIHPRFRTPWKATILAGVLAAIVGSITPIDDIGKMVNIGTLLAFVIVCIAIIESSTSVQDAVRSFGSDSGDPVQRIHDVQAGYLELGAADYLADYRSVCVFLL